MCQAGGHETRRHARARELEALADTIALVADHNAVRSKLAGEMAEAVGQVKALVVQAEDARLRLDMRGMRGHYARLRGLNAELLREYKKRARNHEALVEALRAVNAAIQQAAALRVGEPRARVVAACRAAIKGNNLGAMLGVMASGR